MHSSSTNRLSTTAMTSDTIPNSPGVFRTSYPPTSSGSRAASGSNLKETELVRRVSEPIAHHPFGHRSSSLSVAARILGGQEYIATHHGTSQYSMGGSSACGLACLNCVRIVLNAEANGITGDALLEYMLRRSMIEEALSLCSSFTAKEHLELEEIYKAPLFQTSLHLAESQYGRPVRPKFREMLYRLGGVGNAVSGNRSAAVVITRPPEMVACFKIAHPSRNIFVIFDSHPRQDHPHGAALIFNTSLMKAANYLAELMRYEENAIHDEDLQWQAQLLGNVSGDFFVSSGGFRQASAENLVIAASIEYLASKAEVLALKTRVADLELENRLLLKNLVESRENEERLAANERKQKEAASRTDDSSWTGLIASTSRVLSKNPFEYFLSSSHTISTNNPFYMDLIGIPGSSRKEKDAIPAVHSAYTVATDAEGSSYAYALKLQRQFEQEDTILKDERSDLERHSLATFMCGVCMDNLPRDDVAIVDSCGHSFCRDCARQYAVIKIDEHRFPILCPTCTASKHIDDPGEISEDLLLLLGITEEQYQIFVEMQLASFCILMHCRKCKRGAFVDRGEYEEAQMITCPLPSCDHMWCKQCQQSCKSSGLKHTCDGTAELDRLMSKEGWKYCPTCKTPTEKIMGCNHMTCGAPACNTHYCYLCGALIVQSALRKEYEGAVATHFRSCSLFDDVPDN